MSGVAWRRALALLGLLAAIALAIAGVRAWRMERARAGRVPGPVAGSPGPR